MREHFANILTIGDEVTAGQISNRNSQWMAQQLTDLGLRVYAHHSCNDERENIVSALEFLSKSAAVICITGGLGPTTDDLTRDAIANFTGEPLEFHAPSWERIEYFFRRAGSEPRDTNRQQCYFPRGSEIFANNYGTADGFYLFDKKTHTKIIVLPGPPRELQPMWADNVPSRIKPPKSSEILTSWRLVGIGESALQYEIQKLTPPPKSLRLGYRASMPIVEVKLWQPNETPTMEIENFASELKAILKPWIFEEQEQNIMEIFRNDVIANFPGLVICDQYTAGSLHKILLQDFANASELDFSVISAFGHHSAKTHAPYLNIRPKSDSALVIIEGKFGTEQINIELSPPFAAEREKFNQLAIAYLACKNVLISLNKLPM